MNQTLKILACALIFFACDKSDTDGNTSIADEHGNNILTLNFTYGENYSSKNYENIYVGWIENKSNDFKQNITICNKLINGGLTGTALPYWKINVYPNSEQSEVDAVTSATIANSDVRVSAELKDSTQRQFTVYFEIDRSFEPNDWFSDQPALLYATDVNLDDDVSEYELSFIGWTPNESTQNIIPGTPMGTLQNELRYITHYKENESFGLVDERSATRMVEKITLTIAYKEE